MRTLRLAALVVRSEQARLRHRMARAVTQAMVLLVGLGFLVIGIAVGHLALFELLDARLPRAGAWGVLAGCDAAIALALLALGGRNRPNASEREAAAISRDAALGIQAQFTWAAIFEAMIAWVLTKRR